MKKRDYKLIMMYYGLFIFVVAIIWYYQAQPNGIDYSNYANNQIEVESASASDSNTNNFKEGTLEVNPDNSAVYETPDFTATISDVNDELAWVYVDIKQNLDFNQQIQDYSYLPNSSEFPGYRSTPQFALNENAPNVIQTYVWNYGYWENYLRDYVLWNYTFDIDSEVRLRLIGWANEDKADYLNLYLETSPTFSDEFYGTLSDTDKYERYKNSDILLTGDDVEYITYFMDRYDRYPKQDEVELKGVIPFEKYQELFDLRPLEGRKIQYVVGKPLERYPGYEEEFK